MPWNMHVECMHAHIAYICNTLWKQCLNFSWMNCWKLLTFGIKNSWLSDFKVCRSQRLSHPVNLPKWAVIQASLQYRTDTITTVEKKSCYLIYNKYTIYKVNEESMTSVINLANEETKKQMYNAGLSPLNLVTELHLYPLAEHWQLLEGVTSSLVGMIGSQGDLYLRPSKTPPFDACLPLL